MRWTPQELARDTQGHLERDAKRPVESAFIDSRGPIHGGVFVPIVAARDGHDFIDDAVRGGAAAVLVGNGRESPAGNVSVVRVDDTLTALSRLAACRRERYTGPVVSVSGSNGKTTTRACVAAVLDAAYRPVLATKGNLNNHLGVPLTLLGEPHEPGAMVLEFGMNAPGENEHLAGIVRAEAHVITSIGIEHLEFLHSIEAIAAAEAEPLHLLAHDGVAVVPSDEPLLTSHLRGLNCEIVRVGPTEDADVRILGVDVGRRTRVVMAIRGGQPFEVTLQLFGAHNARNAAAAIAIGLHWGVSMADMKEALERVTPVGDRGRVLDYDPHIVIADCYNANPGSVSVALESLVRLKEMQTIAILGDMLELGPTEAKLHEEIGDVAATLGVNALIGVGPRCRWMVEQAVKRGVDAVATETIEDAVAELRARIESQPSAILLKGSRGMKLERVLERLDLHPQA